MRLLDSGRPLESGAELLDAFPCGLVTTDEQGLISHVNRRMSGWLECETSEIVGKRRFADLLPVAGRVYAQTHLRPLLHLQGAFQEVAVTLKSPSGIERPVLITAQKQGSEKGSQAATYVFFLAEHRLSYERELAASRSDGQMKASWLRQIEGMAGVGAWALDLETNRVKWSDQVFVLHDLPVGEEPDLETALSYYPPHARELVSESIRKTIETREPFRFETELITAAGRSRHVRAFGEPEIVAGRVRRVIGVFQDITEQRAADERLWRAAHVDDLSGLPNRTWFKQRLMEAVADGDRLGAPFVLLLLDLDGFKEVNDTLGHQAGDEVIRVVAERVAQTLGPEAFFARLGGDEFGILLRTASTRESLASLVGKFQASVREPISYEGERAFVTVSVGAASFPDDGLSPDALFKAADMALYSVKRSNRGTIGFFDVAVRTRLDARRAAIELVRRAATEQRIVPHYQPKVRLKDRSVYGFEALARIVNPDGTVCGPADFHRALDDPESARVLDLCMLDAVFADVVRWCTQGYHPGSISLNVTEASLRSGQYVPKLAHLLDEHSLPGSTFELEILETVLVGDDAERFAPMFSELRAAGISIALDDFGTGFASLSHLRDLPIDRVKMDKSFVLGLSSKPQNASILRAIVDLTRDLGLRSTAEGIETDEVCEFLRSIGCEEGQGFLFGRAEAGAVFPKARAGAAKPRRARLRVAA